VSSRPIVPLPYLENHPRKARSARTCDLQLPFPALAAAFLNRPRVPGSLSDCSIYHNFVLPVWRSPGGEIRGEKLALLSQFPTENSTMSAVARETEARSPRCSSRGFPDCSRASPWIMRSCETQPKLRCTDTLLANSGFRGWTSKWPVIYGWMY